MANIGSLPHTPLRDEPGIFGRLIEDHDKHRHLLAAIMDTQGDSADRQRLFKELNDEIKGHAAAEEQALWSTIMRKPDVTEDARHAVAEHHEMDEMLNDLAATDMRSPGWLRKFETLRDEYLHHIKEEEQEQFVHAETHLNADDKAYMKSVFERRKAAEKAKAELTPEKKSD